MSPLLIRLSPIVAVVLAPLLAPSAVAYAIDLARPTEGELRIIGPEGETTGFCPLKHTDVNADVAGFFARVTVRQEFHNPTKTKIEAIYVFPLPQDAAIDAMTLTVGDRTIRAVIKEREEARAIYQDAKARGHVAGLLDQERANIFTQSVANIEPGERVLIEISYVDVLKYEEGWYEFMFPMVVGPRYIPGQPISQTGGGREPDTDEVKDASRITPPIVAEGQRTGHDLSLTVRFDPGRPPADIRSELHQIDVRRDGERTATVTLRGGATIPNRDFVLRYRTATDDVGDALLTHVDERGGFFTLILEPPARILPERLVARELIFVLDTSGSMSGFPIEKAKAVIDRAIAAMRPSDTFNVITFSGDTQILWESPRPATNDNIRAAREFVATRRGGGGTEMMKAIEAALVQPGGEQPDARGPIRIVLFMTDGYVGNDMQIIDAVRKNARTTRVFSFGVGNSVNRYLLDGMARAGRGEVEYVLLSSDADEKVTRLAQRIESPVLTDIAIDWGGAPVGDVQPGLISDLFSTKPVVIHGRYNGAFNGTIRLRGNTAAGPFERSITVGLPSTGAPHAALASLWARSKVAALTDQNLDGIMAQRPDPEIKRQIIDLGLKFALLTQFTSFVAVEELRTTIDGEVKTISVPVEMPDGVSYEGIFGEKAGRPIALGRGGLASLGYIGDAAAPTARTAVTGGAGGLPALKRVGGKPGADAARDDAERIVIERVAPAPADKLAASLRKLVEQAKTAGSAGLADGAVTIDGITFTIRDGKVDVMIRLADLSTETLAALTKLGVDVLGHTKSVSLVIGRVKVAQLMALAELPVVRSIEPMK